MITTPRYRIGNDMTILWAINNKDGSPFDMSGKTVRLFMTHRYGREEVPCSVTKLPDGTINNVIRWDFSGDDQKVLGPYAITVRIYTAEDRKLIRKDICEAFELVAVSCMECEEEGDAVINDGGELILSSKLDIYRFGIPKISIGENGNWFIDGVDTGWSATGGGPGLVNRVYNKDDFGGKFDEKSVVDTFNAHAINDLAQRVTDLEREDNMRLSNLSDVFFEEDISDKDVLIFDGTYWTNVPLSEIIKGVQDGMSSSEAYEALDKRVAAFEKMFYWADEEQTTVGTKYDFFSEKEISAGGVGEDVGTGGGGGVKVDLEMSDTSENAVANKVIKKYVDEAYGQANKYTDEEIERIEGVLNERIDGIVHVVYYYDGLSDEHKAENKKAYDAIMAGIDSCYVITDKTSSTKIIATAALKSSTIAGLMAYQMMPTSKDEITIGILSLSLYEDGSTKQTTTQSYVLNREAVIALLSGKQDVLVSGTTIKTINGQSILGEGDLIIQGGSGGAEVRTLFVNEALTSDELSYNAETIQLIFAQHPMIFFASAEEGTPLSEYELMGMDNGRMVFARYELDEYSTEATYIYLAFDGSTEVGGFNKSELDGDKYDSSLDADSVNAVQNKVVTENIRALEAAMPLMAAIDLDTIIAQDTPIDNATRNALLELGGYTTGDKYFSKGWIWSQGYLYTIKVIPTDAGVQIQLFSFKGWTEIAEDNSKVNHLPSQGGVSIEVDAELSEVSENAVSNKAVTMALAETEEVAAAALNELNERVNESVTKEDLEDALANFSIEVDSAMSDTSENAVSNKVIKKYVDDADKSVKEYVDDADNALSERISALEQNSGGGASVEVDAELSESSTNAVANKVVTEAIVEDEEVISVALNQMNTRFDGYASLDALATEIQNAKDVIDASIIDNEEVAAAALVDLDKRLKDILTILGNAGLI